MSPYSWIGRRQCCLVARSKRFAQNKVLCGPKNLRNVFLYLRFAQMYDWSKHLTQTQTFVAFGIELYFPFWRERSKIICAKYTMFEIWDRDCHIFCGRLSHTEYRTTAKLFKWAPTPMWCDTRTRVSLLAPPSNFKKKSTNCNLSTERQVFTKVGRQNEQAGCQNRREAEMWMKKWAKWGGCSRARVGVKIAEMGMKK